MSNPPTEADQSVRVNVLLLMQERGWSIDDLTNEIPDVLDIAIPPPRTL